MITMVMIASAILVLGMAKHRRRRRTNFSKYLNANVDFGLSIGALATNDVVSGLIDQTVGDTMRVSSIRCVWTLSGWTPLDNAGPIVCGVCHSDYTAGEVEVWMEANGSWDLGDKLAHEVRSRLIRQVGVFRNPELVGGSYSLNGGRPIRTKLNWLLAEGDTLAFWVYNSGSVAVSGATDPNLLINGNANIWVV